MRLRKGFTTGTCAQAAAKGACIMLVRGKMLDKVRVLTPSGARLNIGLCDWKVGNGLASCAVIKDAGDDPDVTHGAKICAEVRVSGENGITIRGARGVGKVTKPGLAVPVGGWAINPVPRRMILREASRFLSKKIKGLEVVISVPQGEKLAKMTFNPDLGIIGGISIIGTTGIVEPRSLDAYKASLSLKLNVLKAQGHNRAVFVLGYVGEAFCRNKLKLKQDLVIKIGDHVGFMLKECAMKGINQVLLIGHIGKLIKITNNQFNTHCRFGDNRLESIARFSRGCGVDKTTLGRILRQETAEAAAAILKQAGGFEVFRRIAGDISQKSAEFTNNKVAVDCILLSLNGEILARTDEPQAA